RRAVALALGVIGVAAIVPALGAVGPPPGGVFAQPVLGVADPEMRLMGSSSPDAGAEAWGYRQLPATVGAPVVGGTKLNFGEGDLAFLHWTNDTGWQYVNTPVDENGDPLGPMGP